ncbi:MAG: type pili signal transduction protein [Massilia sp.]|nr:type pili signal transduction protein [Massilia sp.]
MSGHDPVTPAPVPGQAVRLDAAGRRSRLRQYQEQLLERMQAARANQGASVNQLGVQIGAARYLLELTQAGEIVPLPPLTAVPLTQAWYLGLANIRGNLVGVIDLARYLGVAGGAGAGAGAGTAAGSDARVVTFAAGIGFNCGLLVSRVHGLRQAEKMQPQGDQLVDTDGHAWTPLDLTILVADERFLHVGL